MALVWNEIRDSIDKLVDNAVIGDLYKHWWAAKGDRPLPSEADFGAKQLASHWQNLMVLRPDGANFVYEHYGTSIAAAAGYDMTGKRTSDFNSEVSGFVRKKYMESIAFGKPIYTIHSAAHASTILSWERLMLPIQDEQGAVAIVCYNRPLDRKDDLFDVLMTSSFDGIMILRPTFDGSGAPDGFVFAAANHAAQKMFGARETDLIGRSLGAVHRAAAAQALPVFIDTFKTGKPNTLELEFPIADNRSIRAIRIAVARGDDKLLVTLSDISELRAAQRTLETQARELEENNRSLERQSEMLGKMNDRQAAAAARLQQEQERFRLLADALPPFIAYLDPDYRYLYANRAYCDFLGRDHDDIINSRVDDVIGGLAYEKLKPYIDGALAGRAMTVQTTVPYLDGEKPLDVEINYVPHNGDNGEVLGLFGIVVDVTKYKTIERDLRQAREVADSANRAKSEFLTTMSHEIRTPMNGVLGMAEILLDEGLASDQREKVEIIRSSGQSLMTILNDILDLSKIESGKIDLETIPFSLSAICGTVDKLWREIATEKGLLFSVEIAEGVPDSYLGDPTRIRQILNNLVSNAIKFTETGAVAVTVTGSPAHHGYVTLTISVADTGIGVSDAQRPQLFQKFVQSDASTTRRYGGTGLGLAICKELARFMGGSISLDSALGAGSVFKFSLRIKCQSGSAPAAVGEVVGATENVLTTLEKRPSVLVAEDNGINQVVISLMLTKMGAAVSVVGDGQEAIAELQANRYDLVLMDIHMPGMDGLEATKRIRKLRHNCADVPIIALTGNSMSGDQEKYFAAGMNDYVSKPIQPAVLYEAIARLSG